MPIEKLKRDSDANMASFADVVRELEVLGEDGVRQAVGVGAYGPRKLAIVQEWLRSRERDAERQRRFDDAFEHVLLEPEHEAMLVRLVEAARRVPREGREQFILSRALGGDFLRHAGLEDSAVHAPDIEALHQEGFLTTSIVRQHGSMVFDVSPRGFAYYGYLKRRVGLPAERVVTEVRAHLQVPEFQQRYPAAYAKWAQAEGLLWSDGVEGQLTTIGHLCREALQEFAEMLVAHHRVPEIDPNKAHDVARIKAVIRHHAVRLGDRVEAFLDALTTYWGTVSDLAQRQEHGGQREQQLLRWEDSRRLVFQTALVMFEVDRALPARGSV